MIRKGSINVQLMIFNFNIFNSQWIDPIDVELIDTEGWLYLIILFALGVEPRRIALN